MGQAFHSLSQWLLNPKFPMGIFLGNAPSTATSNPSLASSNGVALQVVTFNSTASAAQVVAHGAPIGTVWSAQGWGKGGSGQHLPLAIASIDGTNVTLNTAGVTAGLGCHIALFFTADTTNRGW